MKILNIPLYFLLILSLNSAFALDPPELIILDKQYVSLLTERVTNVWITNVTRLNQEYIAELNRNIKEATTKGNLPLVMALENEIKGIQSKTPLPLDEENTLMPLKTLRPIYYKEIAKQEQQKANNQLEILTPYIARLIMLESTLTKANRLVDAKAVLIYRESLSKEKSNNSRSLLDEMDWKGLIPLDKDGAAFVLKSNKTESPKLKTRASFTPPFTITVRFIPSSIETRIYWGNGQFIFGWENMPKQIRIHSPLTFDFTPFNGQAPKAGKECVVEAVFDTNKLTISINGRKFYTEKADFKSLNTPIAIGPVSGNSLKLISFDIIQ